LPADDRRIPRVSTPTATTTVVALVVGLIAEIKVGADG